MSNVRDNIMDALVTVRSRDEPLAVRRRFAENLALERQVANDGKLCRAAIVRAWHETMRDFE